MSSWIIGRKLNSLRTCWLTRRSVGGGLCLVRCAGLRRRAKNGVAASSLIGSSVRAAGSLSSNPRTGAEVKVPARAMPHFKIGKRIFECLNDVKGSRGLDLSY
ncbi:MAG: HU family DNA-binding protein [Geminicoccaceae bacterium]